jgi:hypothetical protein
MFSIVVGVVVGILVFLCGYLAGWVNCHSKIKVDAPSTSTNNRSDEIAWLEKVASYPKSIGENFHVGIILKRLAQLRTLYAMPH